MLSDKYHDMENIAFKLRLQYKKDVLDKTIGRHKSQETSLNITRPIDQHPLQMGVGF